MRKKRGKVVKNWKPCTRGEIIRGRTKHQFVGGNRDKTGGEKRKRQCGQKRHSPGGGESKVEKKKKKSNRKLPEAGSVATKRWGGVSRNRERKKVTKGNLSTQKKNGGLERKGRKEKRSSTRKKPNTPGGCPARIEGVEQKRTSIRVISTGTFVGLKLGHQKGALSQKKGRGGG